MATYLIRPEGSTRPGVAFESGQAIVDALRDQALSPSDELSLDGGVTFRAIDTHPAFEEICEELATPPPEPEEETHLDMNPLIDVSLVLLIFFILTATYSTLVRSLDVPAQPPEGPGSTVQPKELRDRAVTVAVQMVEGRPEVTVEKKPVKLDDLEAELTAISRAGNRSEAVLDVGVAVPWEVTARLFEAARGADIQKIYLRARKPG